MKSCHNMDVYLYSGSDPSIEYSDGLRFAPLNFSYPDQDIHFRKTKLDLDKKLWSSVFDFNLTEGETHWSILPPDEFVEKVRAIEGMSEPVNPIQRPV
jgi:hypothetical protein